ncbi:MAG: hypothetical protein HN952_03315 [Candidatus Cloacimonetes bacterium]|jgi:thiol:disulfide interchange protein|nr:hypothetical protein [Candidatus Cloacimonadota bacterium]MBT6993966.1 hypothetical protein [Candidatus Cloacimonadota bacterium]
MGFKKISLAVVLLMSVFLFAQNTNEVVSAIINDSQIEVTFSIPEKMHINLQKDFFYVETDEIDGLNFEETIYPEGHKSADGLVQYNGNVLLIKKFSVGENAKIDNIKIYASYQMCLESGTCMFPEEVEIELPLGNQIPTEKSNTKELIKFLLMAFVGGLILNIMPCVLPVLSIKAMSLVKQSQQDQKQILRSSFAYTAGIVVSFIVMATAIVILKMAGENVGWGFQFQNAGFVTGLLILIFVFALSLFDVFIIRAPGMQTATKASMKGGLTGSFLSGIFAVLLATPCTAPFLGAALGFAFSQSAIMIFAIFILIGLGLAFPFILLGIWPKAIKIIPKPGEWMNIFKEIMGFLLFLTAFYLIRSLSFLVNNSDFLNLLLYLIVLGMSAWIYGRFARPEFSKRKQWIATISAILLAVSLGFVLLDYAPADAHQTEDNAHYPRDWQKFSPELLAEYQNNGKSVFLDFGAEWCLTCKTNETSVLFTDKIESAFKKYDVQMLRGDNTKKNDIINEWLAKFDRAGVPLYVLFIDGKAPIVFPEIITKEMILNKLKENLGDK